jgi:hypothetical protein
LLGKNTPAVAKAMARRQDERGKKLRQGKLARINEKIVLKKKKIKKERMV